MYVHQTTGGRRESEGWYGSFCFAGTSAPGQFPNLSLLALEPLSVGFDGGDDVDENAIGIGDNNVALAEYFVAKRLGYFDARSLKAPGLGGSVIDIKTEDHTCARGLTQGRNGIVIKANDRQFEEAFCIAAQVHVPVAFEHRREPECVHIEAGRGSHIFHLDKRKEAREFHLTSP